MEWSACRGEQSGGETRCPDARFGKRPPHPPAQLVRPNRQVKFEPVYDTICRFRAMAISGPEGQIYFGDCEERYEDFNARFDRDYVIWLRKREEAAKMAEDTVQENAQWRRLWRERDQRRTQRINANEQATSTRRRRPKSHHRGREASRRHRINRDRTREKRRWRRAMRSRATTSLNGPKRVDLLELTTVQEDDFD